MAKQQPKAYLDFKRASENPENLPATELGTVCLLDFELASEINPTTNNRKPASDLWATVGSHFTYDFHHPQRDSF
jgi:hypothetical protein